MSLNMKVGKGGSCDALQLAAIRHRHSRFGLFWPNFHCARAKTAISKLPIKILTSLLDLATLIS